MYREPAKFENKPMHITLTYDEVRKICISHLKEKGMMPKEPQGQVKASSGLGYDWLTDIKGPDLALEHDLLTIHFAIKVPT
jgi:hypothetical protein